MATSEGVEIGAVQPDQQWGPSRTVLHLSDPHIQGPQERLYGRVDTMRELQRVLAAVEAGQVRPDAVIVTGDLTDAGREEAYERLRDEVVPRVESWGSQLIWLNGNHDDRDTMARVLLGYRPDGFLDRVVHVGGLRIICLDTARERRHDGELSAEQLRWLGEQLATPAPEGSLLALHHPPIPTAVGVMALIGLRGVQQLGRVIAGTDVRGVLAGHLHYATHGTLAGVPVSVAAATSYTFDLTETHPGARAQAGGQSWNLVHLFPEGLVHSVVPVPGGPTLYRMGSPVIDRLRGLPPEAMRAAMDAAEA